MKVSKKFRWEGAHRLPWHEGGCQNLHGHSYVLWVELEGQPDGRGMLIDFKVIKHIVKDLIEDWDHATLVDKKDTKLVEALNFLGSKRYELDFDSTSENLCKFVTDHILEKGSEHLTNYKIEKITVRLQETESCYAESSTVVKLKNTSTLTSVDSTEV